jgi:hypothetical protein
MTEMIELKENVRHPFFRVRGWAVAISRPVWNRCVAVPEGVEGQSEEIRLWDLLVFLWANFQDYAAGGGPISGFLFPASVVNDNRDWVESADSQDWPDATVRLLAIAGINRVGRPCLYVMPADGFPQG